MAVRKRSAVPLCLPSNWSFDGEKASGDKLKRRGNLKLCDEGKRVLQDIGDDKVVVICVTGPARSGKSYLISKLVDDVSFEVGHEVFSKTTGIWVACSKCEIQEGEETAKIVLLDAEGVGAVTTEDEGTSAEWDTKLFALCCLLSSVLIYNSKVIPETVDLERLQFVSNYSNLVCSASQGDVIFKESAPNLIWVLRDVLLDPKDSGFENWKEFFYKQVFVERPVRNQTDRSFNAVIHAIHNLFSNFDAKAISIPSTESDVCKNLHKPENAVKISKFLTEIHEVRNVVHNAAKIKRVGSTIMSGKGLLSLIETYVNELDKTGDVLSFKTCWVATVTSHLQEILQFSCHSLEEDVSKIKIPLKEEEIKERHNEAAEKANKYFRDSVRLSDSESLCSFLQTLEQKISASLVSLTMKNENASKRFCREKGDEIINRHFEQISQNAFLLNTTDQFSLYDNGMEIILGEYSRVTEGYPKALDVRVEVEAKTTHKIQSTKLSILEKKICEIYKLRMEDINLPVEEKVLISVNNEAKGNSLAYCREKVNRYMPQYDSLHVSIAEKIDKLFLKFKETNQKMSVCQCESLMKEILQNESLRRHIEKPSIFDYFTYKKEDYYLNIYTKRAVGPAKTVVEQRLKEKLTKLLEAAKNGRMKAKSEVQTKVITAGKWTAIAGAGTAVGVAVVKITTVVAAPAAVIHAVGAIARFLPR